MKILLFGATGMVGGGVLRECLEDPAIESVISVGRTPTGHAHPKLRELVLPDIADLATRADEIGPFDACLYCLGVSSAGMSEERYRAITVGLTVAVLDVVEAREPDSTFCFVSGQGSGNDRVMWARVKGEAEQAVLARPFPGYVFRPGFIQPTKGVRSRTTLYRVLYVLTAPLVPVLKRLAPGAITTSDTVARAMLRAAASGYSRSVLETPDINALGAP